MFWFYLSVFNGDFNWFGQTVELGFKPKLVGAGLFYDYMTVYNITYRRNVNRFVVTCVLQQRMKINYCHKKLYFPKSAELGFLLLHFNR